MQGGLRRGLRWCEMSRLSVWGYDIEWPDMAGAGRRLVGHFVKPFGASEEHPLGPPPVTETPMSKDPHRVELRPDFPNTISFWRPDETIDTLRKLLKAEGVQEYQGVRINIAFPQKNPELFPDHSNGAYSRAMQLRRIGQENAPGIEWRVAHELVEDIKLDRSEDQSSIHALTARQKYQVLDFVQAQAEKPFQFKNPNTGAPELFVVVDACIEQGTTMGNLLSYIEKNGGKVVAALAEGCMDLPQRHVTRDAQGTKFDNKGSKFFDPSRNTGRMPQLAHQFSQAAKREGVKISPQKCLDIFEGRLKLFGNSVFALTDGECERLAETMHRGGHYGKQIGFRELIKKLDDKLEKYADQNAAPPAAKPEAPNNPAADAQARKVTVRLPPAMY